MKSAEITHHEAREVREGFWQFFAAFARFVFP
jgi:hypothetical protein